MPVASTWHRKTFLAVEAAQWDGAWWSTVDPLNDSVLSVLQIQLLHRPHVLHSTSVLLKPNSTKPRLTALRARDGIGRDFRDPTRPETCPFDRRVDRRVDWRIINGSCPAGSPATITTFRRDTACQDKQEKVKTAVYTTVRLHYVDNCQLSLHYHISTK